MEAPHGRFLSTSNEEKYLRSNTHPVNATGGLANDLSNLKMAGVSDVACNGFSAANTAALMGLLPQRLAPWLARCPRLNIDLRERTSAQIVKMIDGGLAEAGVVSDAVNPKGLTIHPVASDHSP
jgi:hypothetical protein